MDAVTSEHDGWHSELLEVTGKNDVQNECLRLLENKFFDRGCLKEASTRVRETSQCTFLPATEAKLVLSALRKRFFLNRKKIKSS